MKTFKHYENSILKFHKKNPIYISLLFFFSLTTQIGFGQSCPNNVSTPSGCPTSQVGEIDVSMGVPPSFCINPSDSGCGTIRFINIPSEAVHGCPVELCFTPSQGCGVAGTNLCLYVSDGMGGCNFLQTGSSENGICVSPTGSTYEITICRPGNGPVSAQNLSINTCCMLDADCARDNDACFGESNGQVSVTTTGGTDPVTYQWSANTGSATTSVVSGLPAGVYTVTATDANGCTDMCAAQVNQPTSAVDAQCARDNDVSCFNGSDGQVSVTAVGGTPPYTYQWAANAGSSTNQVVSGLPAGVYTVTATDANGCTEACAAQVNQPTSAVDAQCARLQDASCFGASDGVVQVNAVGGTPPYSFQWQATGTNSSTNQTVGGLPTGLYFVTATDANGCTESCAAQVNDPTPSITCPNPITVECDLVGVDAWLNTYMTNNVCPDNTVSHNFNAADYNSCTTITNNVTFSVMNPAGQVIADCVTSITVNAAPIPVITCPNLPAIDCIDVANYVPPMASYAGTCGIGGMVSGIVTSAPSPLSCGGTLVITYSGVDECNRPLAPITCTVTVNAAPAPTPASILFLSPISCEMAAAFVAPPLPYSNNQSGDCNISGTLPPVVQNNWTVCGGEIIINYDGMDVCGNLLSSGPHVITVNPAPLPTVTPPSFPTSISCIEAEAFVAPNATFTNGLPGVCNLSGEIVATITNNWDACGGQLIVNYNGFDECQRPLTAGPFTIDVQPAPLPVITPPAYSSPMTCETAASFVPGDATYTNGLSGACNISGTIPAAFDNNFDACGGNITVYYFGFDDCGRFISATPIILAVQPAPIPTITAPPLPSSVSCDEAGTYMAPNGTYDNGLPGLCNLSGTATTIVNRFFDACGGTLQVIYLGEDDCGRSLTKNIKIINVDPAPTPTITPPSIPTSLSCSDAQSYNAPIASYDNGLDGDCNISGLIDPVTTYDANACDGGTMTITYNGTDDCGNVITAAPIVVQVEPASLPTLKGPSVVPATIFCWDAAYGYNPGNATYTNGEIGLCENSGEIEAVVTEIWNACDGGYIIYDYSGVDDCGNELMPLVIKVAVLPDTWAPDGACAPYEETMAIQDVPEPDELDYYFTQVAYGYYEACSEVVVTLVGDTGDPECSGEGHFERVYTVEISDGCGNVSGTCTITFSGYCNPSYCTLSQKFYGYPDAEMNGQSSEDIVNELLGNGTNPIVIGDGTDCGFIIDEAQCIKAMLNSYGPAVSLPSGYSSDCSDTNNSLINQMVTTILNIRYNESLNPAGSLDYGNFSLSAACLNIPGWMLAELPPNPTVNDLLDYANKYLACQCDDTCGNYQATNPTIGCLTNLFWGLNSRFNNCHVPGSCGSNFSNPDLNGETPVLSNNTLELYPNPTKEYLNLKVTDFIGLPATIEIFDTRGAKLGEKTYQPIEQNVLEFDVQNFEGGLYWISIKVEGHDQITKKFIVEQ